MRSRHPLFLLFSLAVFAVASIPAVSLADSRAELDERARRAGEVFRELDRAPDRGVPADLMARAYCVASIPNVIKAAWIIGGRYGKGLLSCRSKSGEWSPPLHVMMTGGSFGFQVGVSSTDVVLFFMTPSSVRSMLESKIQLSGEAGVAAGPFGRDTAAATDGRFLAQIYTYARSRGVFAGVSLAGGYLGVDQQDTNSWYGRSYSPAQVLFERKVTKIPKAAWLFLAALPQPKRATKPATTTKARKPVAKKPVAKKPGPSNPVATKPAPAPALAAPAPAPSPRAVAEPAPMSPNSVLGASPSGSLDGGSASGNSSLDALKESEQVEKPASSTLTPD